MGRRRRRGSEVVIRRHVGDGRVSFGGDGSGHERGRGRVGVGFFGRGGGGGYGGRFGSGGDQLVDVGVDVESGVVVDVVADALIRDQRSVLAVAFEDPAVGTR